MSVTKEIKINVKKVKTIFNRFIFGNKMTHNSELASPLKCR